MRILVITNLYPPEHVGGWELGCNQMVDELRRRGHDVLVLTATPRTFEDGGAQTDVDHLLRVEEIWDPVLLGVDAPSRLVRRMLVDPHNVEILHYEVDRFVPDVVYVWNVLGLGAAAMLLSLDIRGIPWVVHLMDALPIYVASAAGSARSRFAKLLFPRLAGTWIACSQGLLDEISDSAAPLAGRVLTIPNWITNRPPKRTSWYTPGTTLRCAYSGQIVAVKGIGILLESIHNLRGEGCALEVDLYGDGADRRGFEAHAIRLGIADAVRFHGNIPQSALMARLQEHDVLLFPTAMREPFGFAALEAAATGCVPLATGGAGICEWLVPGVHLMTARRDARDVTDALRRVLMGDVQLEPIGQRGQNLVLEQFHIEVVADRVEAVLVEAAAEPRARDALSWLDIGRLGRLAELLSESLLSGD